MHTGLCNRDKEERQKKATVEGSEDPGRKPTGEILISISRPQIVLQLPKADLALMKHSQEGQLPHCYNEWFISSKIFHLI